MDASYEQGLRRSLECEFDLLAVHEIYKQFDFFTYYCQVSTATMSNTDLSANIIQVIEHLLATTEFASTERLEGLTVAADLARFAGSSLPDQTELGLDDMEYSLLYHQYHIIPMGRTCEISNPQSDEKAKEAARQGYLRRKQTKELENLQTGQSNNPFDISLDDQFLSFLQESIEKSTNSDKSG